MTTDQTVILVAALLMALVAAALAAYERGYHNGRNAHQCEDEMRLVGEAKGRHPSRCEECS